MADQEKGDSGDALFVVDRRETTILVLVDESGRTTEVAAAKLPAACRVEGAVLRIPLDGSSHPVWQKAARDVTEEKRRRDINAARLERLQRKDSGGRVSL